MAKKKDEAPGIKSALELAMERMAKKNGEIAHLTNEQKAAIAEIGCEEAVISEHFGSSIHLFLLPGLGVKIAALIPKKTYLTLCLLGREMSGARVDSFLSHPVFKSALPPSLSFEPACRCLPKMSVGPPPSRAHCEGSRTT